MHRSRRAVFLVVLALAAGAVLLWQRSRRSPNDEADRLYLQASQLVEQGDRRAAIQEFKRLVILRPDYADGYAGLGNAYLLAGELDAAAQAMEIAVSLNPERPHVYCQLADTYVQLRAREAAVRAIETALKRDPRCAHAHLVAGEQWLRDDDLTRAVAEFRESIRLDAQVPTAYQRAGYVLIELDRPAEAEPVLKEGLRVAPDRPDLHLQLARLYAARSNDPAAAAEAEKHYTQALQNNPDAADIQAALGGLAQRRNDLAGARRWWETALRLNRNQAQALYGMAQLSRAEKKPGDARIFLERFQEVQKFQQEVGKLRSQTALRRDPALRMRLARMALESGNVDEAERQLAVLLEERPADVEVRTLAGRLHLLKQEPDQARREFEAASVLSQDVAL